MENDRTKLFATLIIQVILDQKLREKRWNMTN